MLITRLLLVLEVWDGKPTYRKLWAGNLLMWSDLTLDPSFKVMRGQPNLKVLITCLLLVPEICILWAGNLLMSDLTFDPSFKVKRWFTGFGELSFRWIQICIGSPMRRSSFIYSCTRKLSVNSDWEAWVWFPVMCKSRHHSLVIEHSVWVLLIEAKNYIKLY